ncbi:MAG TPA: hypothetical protein VFX14_03280 [Methylomirabilota bacterium]|nr:hypothetical protein [Methylomirabilota bacterium]
MAELTRRYIVMPMSTEGPFDPRDPDAPFVLKPWKDPAALRALEAYRDVCYPELAQDLTVWITAIRSGPVVRGSVGSRNESHIASRRAARSTPRPKPKGRPKARSRKQVKKKPRRKR